MNSFEKYKFEKGFFEKGISAAHRLTVRDSLVVNRDPRISSQCGGPVPLVLDLRIAHDRVGSSNDPTLNGHLKYPNNVDQSLNVKLMI